MVSSLNPNVQDMHKSVIDMRTRLEHLVKQTGQQRIILAKMTPGHLPTASDQSNTCTIERVPTGLALEYIGCIGSAPLPGKGLIGRSRLFAHSMTGLLPVGERYENIIQSARDLPDNTIVSLDLEILYRNEPFAHANMPLPFPTRPCSWAHEGDSRIYRLLHPVTEWPGKPNVVLKICNEFSERCAYISWTAKGVGMCSCEVVMEPKDKSSMDADVFGRLQATVWVIARTMDVSSNLMQRVYALLDG